MKVQIRRGGFETNSSSMHALLIMKKRQTMTQQEIRDELGLDEEWCKNKDNILKLYFYNNYFGRRFDVLTSFLDKLNYAMASFCGNCYSLKSYIEAGEKFESVFEPLLIELVGVDVVEMPMDSMAFNIYSDTITEDTIQDYGTYEEVPYGDLDYNSCDKNVTKTGRHYEKIWLEVPDFGEVDHQSSDLLQGFLKKYGITLREFLTRKDIMVIVDSDEICMLSNMTEAGLIDRDAIQIKYPNGGRQED